LLRFETWRSLARVEALGDPETADLMITFTQAVAAHGPRHTRSGAASQSL
jgi:hypothetical protein